MRQSSGRILAIVGRQMRWFAWSLGAPLDPRWAESDLYPGRARTHGRAG